MTPGSGSANAYGYDASGNPTTLPTGASGSYDDASELTSSTLSGTTTDYTYNQDGERTQQTVGGTTTASATYDAAQDLTSYSGSAADMTAATYDGDGLRQSATTTPTGGTSTTEHFTWDPSGSLPRLLMDSTNAYIYGPDGTPFEQVNLNTGTVQYLLSDALGSVRGVIDSTGALTTTTNYDAWGNPETTGGLTSYTPFGYAGNYTDPTGLTYNQARYYDPTTSQFLTVDPLVDQTGEPYEYAGGDPVDNIDPTGLGVLSDAGNFFAGAASGLTGGVSTHLLNYVGITPNICSFAYQAGQPIGLGTALLIPGEGEADFAATAAEDAAGGADEAFHYTSSEFTQSIANEGLRPGSYATASGDLSPLQAQIDLALPPNRGLPDGLIRVDLAGLRGAGYDVPEFTQVGRSFNMPGGGTELQFPYAVPSQFLQVVR